MSRELMNRLEHLQSTRESIILVSFKGGLILLMKGAFLPMEELVGEVEASQRKKDTSREVEASPPMN